MSKKSLTMSTLMTSGFYLLLNFLPGNAFASTTGVYAWETILRRIADSLTGPVAYAVAIMAIVMCGFAMAFADLQSGAKQFVQVGCGLSVVIFSTQLLTNFFGFSGALV